MRFLSYFCTTYLTKELVSEKNFYRPNPQAQLKKYSSLLMHGEMFFSKFLWDFQNVNSSTIFFIIEI